MGGWKNFLLYSTDIAVPISFFFSGKRQPNQQRTLNKLNKKLRCRNLVHKHQLSTQISAKLAKACVQRAHIPTELPFCMPPFGGWAVCLLDRAKVGGEMLKMGSSLLPSFCPPLSPSPPQKSGHIWEGAERERERERGRLRKHTLENECSFEAR